MSVESELEWKQRGTVQFIAANPVTLVLIPSVETKTPAGGKVSTDGPARLPQVLRLIDQSTPAGSVPGLLRAQDGAQRQASHMLLGAHDSLMAVGDHWTGADGKRYQVKELLPFNGYEQRGMVVCYG